MKNKAKNQQSNNEKKEEWPSEKTYDVFISYRRPPSDAAVQRHSTSLARSIALELESEGFSVYLDCRTDRNDFMDKIEQSKYFFVLLTSYSWDDDSDESKGGENFKKEINKNSSENKGGENFKKEINKIKKGIKDGRINKDNVWWLDVDDSAKNRIVKDENGKDKKVQHKEYKKIKKKYQITPFPTNGVSLIKDFINEPKNGSRRIIRKADRISCEKYKELHETAKRKYDFSRRINTCVIILLLIALCGQHIMCNNKIKSKEIEINGKIDTIKQKDTIIEQFNKECIVFAGGGTVRRFLSDAQNCNIDVNDYFYAPSKYIHLPSTDAWSLLWDDFTEDGKSRRYWPVVLSAEKINIPLNNKGQLNNEIVEFEVGTAPLIIQIIGDNCRWRDSICPKDLCELLMDTSYTVHTTTEQSGTYNAYKKLLYDRCNKFDLDRCMKGKKDRWQVFTPRHYNKIGRKHIFLANSYYNYEHDKNQIIVCDNMTQNAATVPLYVYTIAAQIHTENEDERELCPQIKDFLYRIGCDTTQSISFTNGITVLNHDTIQKKYQQQQ